LILDLNELPSEGLAVDRWLELDDQSPAGPLVPAAVHLVARARNGPRGVEFKGRLEAVVRLECSRCLEATALPLAEELSLTLVSEAPEYDVAERQIAPEESSLYHVAQGRVDLRELAREQVYLNIPLKPICREGCAGLCPTCGANRNRIECGCGPAPSDPRLEVLRVLGRPERGMDGAVDSSESGGPDRRAADGNDHAKSET